MSFVVAQPPPPPPAPTLPGSSGSAGETVQESEEVELPPPPPRIPAAEPARPVPSTATPSSDLDQRIAALEQQVEELQEKKLSLPILFLVSVNIVLIVVIMYWLIRMRKVQ